MTSPEQDRGDYVLKLDVGRAFSTRATVHLTYNADADCEELDAYLQAPLDLLLTLTGCYHW